MDILSMRRIFLLLIAMIATLSSSSFAQLSPGKLSKPHAYLEGLENCNKCHGFEQQLSSEKCLACHTYLGERLKAGKGIHANPAYKQCESCHVEHQGEDFKLVFWKGGQDSFDHSLTGYILDGKHTAVKCRDCHQSKNISIDISSIEPKKDLVHTFQGLGPECATCHIDEHRGQVSTKCASCHTTAAWKPPTGFTHTKAKFNLTGKHETIPCEKCHLPIVDNRSPKDKDYLKLTGIKSERCFDCHKDPHSNKFGQNCEGCHNTGGWKDVPRGQFDHSKTHFPLVGKHVAVNCEKCHTPGKPFKSMKYEKCQDCHQDYHLGQFVSRVQKGACEECHTVSGYSPTKFTIEEHAKSKYPLSGSHLAIPCIACHKEWKVDGQAETIRFKFENTRCLTCHKDPHKGQVDKYISKDGCEFCHSVESWRQTKYDHAQTKFPLEGKHLTIACRACHSSKDKKDKTELQIAELPLKCQGCHKDNHRNQFALDTVDEHGKPETKCTRCHTPSSWKPEKFDHNRDSVFKLDGAHIKVACIECHKETLVDDKAFIQYKPLSSTCSSCHAGKDFQGGKS